MNSNILVTDLSNSKIACNKILGEVVKMEDDCWKAAKKAKKRADKAYGANKDSEDLDREYNAFLALAYRTQGIVTRHRELLKKFKL